MFYDSDETRLRGSARVDLDSALGDGRLVVVEAPGRTVQESLRYWEEVFWATTQKRGAVLRVVGDAASERDGFTSEAEMLAYEAALNTLTRRFPGVLLCQYDVRAFSGEAVLAALRAHPDLYGLPLRNFIA